MGIFKFLGDVVFTVVYTPIAVTEVFVIDPIKEKGYNKGYQDGKVESEAKNLIKIQKLIENLKEVESRFKEHKEHEEFIVALFAVGLSAANCDGEINKEEINDLEMFISGESFKKLPESLKAEISRLYTSPPSLSDAMIFVERVAVKNWVPFDYLINIIIESDGSVRDEEKAFLKAWEEIKKRNKLKL